MTGCGTPPGKHPDDKVNDIILTGDLKAVSANQSGYLMGVKRWQERQTRKGDNVRTSPTLAKPHGGPWFQNI